MHLPAFYSHAPRVLVRDPLAELLGAADGGLIEYGYADAVRLAGHSCPTVAGAYLMARAGLRALYPDTLPERGGVVVTMGAAEVEGTTGEERAAFGSVWQDRVRRLLLEHADDPNVIRVERR